LFDHPAVYVFEKESTATGNYLHTEHWSNRQGSPGA
jgi:hypothetical protein